MAQTAESEVKENYGETCDARPAREQHNEAMSPMS